MKNRVVLLAVLLFLGLGFVTALSVSVVKSRQAAVLQSEVSGLRGEISSLSAQITRLIAQRPVTKTIDFDALAIPANPVGSNGTVSVEVHAAELENLYAALDERNAQLEQLRADMAAAGEPRRERPQQGPTEQTSFVVRMRKSMDQLQQENPEAYELLQKERQERRVQLANATHERADFFKNIDTEGLPEATVDNHKKLVEKLQEFDDAMARILADPDSEESDQLRRETFGNWHEISGLMAGERKLLLTDFAKQLGYSQDESTQFVDYVDSGVWPLFGTGFLISGGFLRRL